MGIPFLVLSIWCSVWHLNLDSYLFPQIREIFLYTTEYTWWRSLLGICFGIPMIPKLAPLIVSQLLHVVSMHVFQFRTCPHWLIKFLHLAFQLWYSVFHLANSAFEIFYWILKWIVWIFNFHFISVCVFFNISVWFQIFHCLIVSPYLCFLIIFPVFIVLFMFKNLFIFSWSFLIIFTTELCNSLSWLLPSWLLLCDLPSAGDNAMGLVISKGDIFSWLIKLFAAMMRYGHLELGWSLFSLIYIPSSPLSNAWVCICFHCFLDG